jgi:hypothetical protein
MQIPGYHAGCNESESLKEKAPLEFKFRLDLLKHSHLRLRNLNKSQHASYTIQLMKQVD